MRPGPAPRPAGGARIERPHGLLAHRQPPAQLPFAVEPPAIPRELDAPHDPVPFVRRAVQAPFDVDVVVRDVAVVPDTYVELRAVPGETCPEPVEVHVQRPRVERVGAPADDAMTSPQGGVPLRSLQPPPQAPGAELGHDREPAGEEVRPVVAERGQREREPDDPVAAGGDERDAARLLRIADQPRRDGVARAESERLGEQARRRRQLVSTGLADGNGRFGVGHIRTVAR